MSDPKSALLALGPLLLALGSVLLALGPLLLLAGAGSVQAQPAPGVKTVSDTVALDSAGTVEVDNHRGSITIATWNRAEVGYQVRIEPPTKGEDLPFTSLNVSPSEQELDLASDYPWRFQLPGVLVISPGGTERAIFHYTVTVPKSADLQLDGHASKIKLSGTAGHVTVETQSGSIRGTNLSGGLDLETHSGDVRLTFARLTAPISIESSDGPVRLTLPKDAGFNLETTLTRADQLTASGALSLPAPTDGNYEGPVNGGGPLLSLESHAGTIELRTR